MCKPFRDAVLEIPIKETHRSSSSHLSDEELVGLELLLSTSIKSSLKEPTVWEKVSVRAYNSDTGKHTLESPGKSQFEVCLRGTPSIRFRIAPNEDDEPLMPVQENAIRVVEQLQRTFCFMKHSKKRFFDPILLVDACKTLDLQYLVMQQNDAAELFDKLLDRVELVAKVKLPGEKFSFWQNVFCRRIFGAQTHYGKTPNECTTFEKNKEECGHWRDRRIQPANNSVALQVTSKDKVDDSLDEAFAPEMLEGIDCDVCNEKKGVVRRSRFGTLPNTLVLHLKRFDMDYNTFETVKVNNRHEFPVRLNLLRHTKAGHEAEERRVKREQDGKVTTSPSSPRRRAMGNLSYEEEVDEKNAEPDPLDYEYELQGVLIHAGVAGGGHYYSFARDPENTDVWYRLDDDEVTPYDLLENIEKLCYGGIFRKENGAQETRTANALMVFYNKVRPSDNDPELDPILMAETKPAAAVDAKLDTSVVRMVTGHDAYYREVMESNNEHTMTSYLSDTQLHSLVRSMVEALVKARPVAKLDAASTEASMAFHYSWTLSEDLLLSTVRFGCQFFLDIVLRCHSRSEYDWIDCFRRVFVAFPRSALDFIQQLTAKGCSWFEDYFRLCVDVRARISFVNIVVDAVNVVASVEIDYARVKRAAENFVSDDMTTTSSTSSSSSSSDALGALIANIHARIFKVPQAIAQSHELFSLVSQIAAIEPVRKVLLEMKTLSLLSYFIVNDHHHIAKDHLISEESLRKFEEAMDPTKKRLPDFNVIYLSVFEAVGALLNLPSIRKARLLNENCNGQTIYDFTPEAKAALTTIFRKAFNNSVFATESDFGAYVERVILKGKKATLTLLRINFFDPYATNCNGIQGVTVDGFLKLFLERILLHGERFAWDELYNWKFSNDLTESSEDGTNNTFAAQAYANTGSLDLVPWECLQFLYDSRFYESAIVSIVPHIKSMFCAILYKVCYKNLEISKVLLHQVSR